MYRKRVHAGVEVEQQWEDGTIPLSKPEFASWLRRCVEDRNPAAVVRFGDAEARLLKADPSDSESIEVAIQKLAAETGRPFSPTALLEVKALVELAYDEADVLGIRFVRGFLEDHRRWMNSLFDLYAERVAAGRRPAVLAHCLLGHDVVDALPGLLAGRPVSVISCRDLKPVLEAEWGLRDVAVYQVPSQHTMRDVDGPYEAALHEVAIWPAVHARIRTELTVRERGEVFLVGAGLFGKDLCIRIRDQGGIALDMGSALDGLAGKVTRGPQRRILDLSRRGHSVEEIAARLSHLYGIEVSADRVSAVIETAFGTLPPGKSMTDAGTGET